MALGFEPSFNGYQPNAHTSRLCHIILNSVILPCRCLLGAGRKNYHQILLCCCLLRWRPGQESNPHVSSYAFKWVETTGDTRALNLFLVQPYEGMVPSIGGSIVTIFTRTCRSPNSLGEQRLPSIKKAEQDGVLLRQRGIQPYHFWGASSLYRMTPTATRTQGC